MTTSMTIGEFSRVTHLSVKALRHYHDLGLLEPDVDPVNGYRRYDVDQVPAAHLIRRLRDLDMPLSDVAAVLRAPDVDVRNRTILAHLQRMERHLERTQAVVASLRDLLERQRADIAVEHRSVAATAALAIRERVAFDDIAAWCQGAYPELYEAVRVAGLTVDGAAGALYADDYFTQHHGEVVAYVPVARAAARATGRVAPFVVPAGRVAVTVHEGGYAEIDRTYGALGAYVAANDIGAPGPIRERYLVGPDHSADVARFRTEICWPIDEGARP